MDLVVSPVSGHFWFRKVSWNRTNDSCQAPNERCKKRNSWGAQVRVTEQWTWKMSRSRKATKSFVIQKTWQTKQPSRCLEELPFPNYQKTSSHPTLFGSDGVILVWPLSPTRSLITTLPSLTTPNHTNDFLSTSQNITEYGRIQQSIQEYSRVTRI